MNSKKQLYNREFYESRDVATRNSAEAILRVLFGAIPIPRRVVDFGCGVGTWLSVSQSLGAVDVLGVDGPWVDRDLLVIPSNCFVQSDLLQFHLEGRRFDLAICLEVAEHLPVDRAGELVAKLTESADVVLFSAAVPGQPGTGHINCQWPQWWAELFFQHGFIAKDVVRPSIWRTEGVPYFYRQNAVIYVSRERKDIMDKLSVLPSWCTSGETLAGMVHPELYLYSQGNAQSVSKAWKQLLKNLKKSMGIEPK